MISPSSSGFTTLLWFLNRCPFLSPQWILLHEPFFRTFSLGRQGISCFSQSVTVCQRVSNFWTFCTTKSKYQTKFIKTEHNTHLCLHKCTYKSNIKQCKYTKTIIIIIIIQRVFLDVCSVLFLFCLYICKCVYLQIQVPLGECRSIQ